ncbi:MAG: DUF5343 domain-containing protein [Gemmatimonadota bacterium]|nr:DUF5343 domain-containing protein [Gemmatimonadota bacterium]
MPTPLPFVGSYGKVKPLFEKIASAKVPDAFTQKYLAETLGLTSTADRPLIPLLRALGFIDAAGRPSPNYAALKNPQRAGSAIAKAIRHAYAPLFAANETAHLLSNDELKGLVAQVAGTDEDPTARAAGTFRALVGLADPKALADGSEQADDDLQGEKQDEEQAEDSQRQRENGSGRKEVTDGQGGLRPEFHYNIQVHLPSSGTEETYLNIFNALRKALS